MAFGFETTATQALAGIDLSGKMAVITGATSGIGLETARALATAGAEVVITARDKTKADEALAKLRAEVPDGKFDSVAMELGSLKSARAAAGEVLSRHPKIDILINNAGVMATPLGRTEDGFEIQFGVDHLGHFVFANMLVPALIAAAASRVVCLSSAAHLNSDILWDDVNFDHTPYDKFKAYGQAKTANMLFALGLDRRLAHKGVNAYGVHPGAINTGLGRYLTKDDIAVMKSWRQARSGSEGQSKPAPLSFKSIPQGAASSVWAATAPELAGKGGVYIQDCGIAPPHTKETMGVKAYALDPVSADRLWSLSEKLVGQAFTF